MTSRAEIERLLQMTGRTLEGLPKEYPVDRCRAVGRIHGLTPAIAGNSILHQSDVIELLVGALRDALDVQKTEISDAEDEEELMDAMINGRTTEEIKIGLLCSNGCCDCPYAGFITEDETCSEYVEKDTIALIERLESERDAALAKVPEEEG